MDEFDSAKRKAQLKKLKEWEAAINKASGESVPIVVENNVDLDGPPTDMTYIRENKPAPGIVIPDDPPLGCECRGACSISTERTCCPSTFGHMFPYTKFGRLRVQPGTPIYECNKMCKCGTKCYNRVIQKGRTVKLCIFKTDNGCGWGVKTLQNITRGTFVAEYLGEVITSEEAERRGEAYDANGQTYLFDLDVNLGEANLYTIDAAKFGNITHFINHSCDPNLAIYNCWVNCLDPNLPRVCFFALRDIVEGEELSFDYKQQTSDTPAKLAARKAAAEMNDGGTECKCGMSVCRKIIF